MLKTDQHSFPGEHGRLMLLIVLLCQLAMPSLAQDASRYFVRHFDTDNGLPQNSIKGMKMDAKGYLWILTEAGLVRFDGRQFKTFDQLPGGVALTRRIGSLHLLGRDTIVIVDVAGNHYRAAGFGCLIPFPPRADILQHQHIRSGLLAGDINNRCYWKVVKKEKPAWIMPSFQLNNIRSGKGFNLLGDTCFWFNARNELIVADSGLRHFKRMALKGFPSQKDSLLQVAIVPHPQKLLIQWGEYLCTARVTGANRVEAELVIHTGPTGALTSLEMSPSDNVFFVGTLTQGFYQYNRKEFSTRTFTGNTANVFYAVAPIGRDGVLTNQGIVTGNNKPQLDSFRAFSVLRTKAGRYVLMKWGHHLVNGLSFFDSTLRQVDFLPLPEPAIGYMYELSDSSVCVVALGFRFGRLHRRRIEWYDTLPALQQFQVSAIEEIRPGLLWLAGPQGLARFDIHTRRFESIPGIEGLGARCIFLDPDGILWIGTYGNGFYACVQDRIIKMPLDPDGYLRQVHTFLVDGKGCCWISTNRGLFQVSLKQLQAYARSLTSTVYYHYYDKNSGFLTNEFNGGCFPAAISTREGRFTFPSMKGIVQFDPLAIQPILSASDIYIDRITADTHTLHPTQAPIRLPGNLQRLEWTISSPFWGTPNNHRVEYRLIGLDSLWHPVPANGVMSFERLPGGQYELTLRKKNGFDGQQVLKIQRFTIPPPFYQRWWFKIALPFIVALGGWLASRLRFRYLTQKQQRLENEVALRTRELLRHTRLLETVSMTISHDLQSPLRFLSDVSASLHEKAGQAGQPALEALSRELSQASRNIHSFVKDFGYWVKSLQQGFAVNKEHIDLDKLLEEPGAFTREILKQRGNTMSVEGAAGMIIESDRQLLHIILRNLVDNANKHTRNGHITIAVHARGHFASITVADTGRGFSPGSLTAVQHILRHPFNGVGAVEGNRGFGYYFISDFSRLLGITVQLENRLAGGAAITLQDLKVVTMDLTVGKTIEYDTRPFS